jgi:predicted nucleic acid-binding protein
VPLISTITLAELSVGPLVATSERDRADRQAVLQQAEADFNPLPFDAAAARAFGRVAAALRRRGASPTRARTTR